MPYVVVHCNMKLCFIDPKDLKILQLLALRSWILLNSSFGESCAIPAITVGLSYYYSSVFGLKSLFTNPSLTLKLKLDELVLENIYANSPVFTWVIPKNYLEQGLVQRKKFNLILKFLRYKCDYCEVILRHYSPSVQKTHLGGKKHKEAVRLYYQTLVDGLTAKILTRIINFEFPNINFNYKLQLDHWRIQKFNSS